jgi:hypothetical protein
MDERNDNIDKVDFKHQSINQSISMKDLTVGVQK